jgi:hypothetical protein
MSNKQQRYRQRKKERKRRKIVANGEVFLGKVPSEVNYPPPPHSITEVIQANV